MAILIDASALARSVQAWNANKQAAQQPLPAPTPAPAVVSKPPVYTPPPAPAPAPVYTPPPAPAPILQSPIQSPSNYFPIPVFAPAPVYTPPPAPTPIYTPPPAPAPAPQKTTPLLINPEPLAKSVQDWMANKASTETPQFINPLQGAPTAQTQPNITTTPNNIINPLSATTTRPTVTQNSQNSFLNAAQAATSMNPEPAGVTANNVMVTEPTKTEQPIVEKPAVVSNNIAQQPATTVAQQPIVSTGSQSFTNNQALSSAPIPIDPQVPVAPPPTQTAPTGQSLSSLLGNNVYYKRPEYSGLSEQQLQSFGNSLLRSGETQINRASDESLARSRDVLGGKGLYGSSIMSDVYSDSGERRASLLQQNEANVADQVMKARQADLAARNQFEADIYKEQGLGARQLAGQSFQTGERIGAQDFTMGLTNYQANVEATRDARLQGYTLDQITADYAGKAKISQQEYINRLGELAQTFGYDLARMDKDTENQLLTLAASAGYDQDLAKLQNGYTLEQLTAEAAGKYYLAQQAGDIQGGLLKDEYTGKAILSDMEAKYAQDLMKSDYTGKAILADMGFNYDTSKMSIEQKNALERMLADYAGQYYMQKSGQDFTAGENDATRIWQAYQNSADRAIEQAKNSSAGMPDNSLLIAQKNIDANRELAQMGYEAAGERSAADQAFTTAQNQAQYGYWTPETTKQETDWEAYRQQLGAELTASGIDPNTSPYYKDPQKHYNEIGQYEQGRILPTVEVAVAPTYVPGAQEGMNMTMRDWQAEVNKMNISAEEKSRLMGTIQSLGPAAIQTLGTIWGGPLGAMKGIL